MTHKPEIELAKVVKVREHRFAVLISESPIGFFDAESQAGMCASDTNAALAPVLQKVRDEAYEQAANVAETEPEFPGKMSDDIRERLERLSLEEQQRRAVWLAKKAISEKIRSLKGTR